MNLFHQVSTLVSMMLTVPLLVFGTLVILHLIFKRDWKVDNRWLKLGILFGFVGMNADNTWWGIAWAMDFLSLSYKEWWFEWGVVANVPFRQVAGCVSGYLHLLSFWRSPAMVNVVLLFSMAFGAIFAMALILFRGSL